jgi:hypothetical protein
MIFATPDLTICRVKFPYTIDYIRYRGRKPKAAHIPELADIGIRTVSETEAPVAFAVTSNGFPQQFEVREFDDACWWPVGDDQGFVPVRRFAAALADGDHGYLALLFRSLKHSILAPWKETRFVDLHAREIVSSDLDAKLRLVHRGAYDFLFCGDRVLVKGRDPVYCYLPPEPGEPHFALGIADPEQRLLSQELNRPRPLGAGTGYFQESAVSGNLFRADEKEKLEDLMRSRGIKDGFSADIKVLLPRNIRSDPVQMQAETLVKVLNRLTSVRFVPADYPYFRPLFDAHARLGRIAAQKKIETDEAASVLAQFSVWCARSGTLERYDASLGSALERFTSPIHDFLKKARAEWDDQDHRGTFLDKRDVEALNSLGP